MTGLADVYVLSPRRSKTAFDGFLDRFLPDRAETADEYEVPRFSDRPRKVFGKADDLLTYLCENPDEPHAVYWVSRSEGDPRYAMVFPTTSGQVVYGLSVESNEREFLERLKAFLDSAKGYIDYENPPPTNPCDFEKMAGDFDNSR